MTQKSWLCVLVGVLGLSGPTGAEGWNVLSNHARPLPQKVVATFDLKGSACVVDLKGGARSCPQKRSAAPVMVKLTRSHQVYPDGHVFDTLSLALADNDKVALWTAEELKTTDDGSGFQIVGLELKKGRAGWLEIHTLEHALPGKNAANFMPGPPLTRRYVYDGERFIPGPQ